MKEIFLNVWFLRLGDRIHIDIIIIIIGHHQTTHLLDPPTSEGMSRPHLFPLNSPPCLTNEHSITTLRDKSAWSHAKTFLYPLNIIKTSDFCSGRQEAWGIPETMGPTGGFWCCQQLLAAFTGHPKRPPLSPNQLSKSQCLSICTSLAPKALVYRKSEPWEAVPQWS